MEEKDEIREQSVTAEVQGEAPALQSVRGPTVLSPAVQIIAQMAQRMATFFQQMADNLSAQVQVQTQPPQGQYETEKNDKIYGSVFE